MQGGAVQQERLQGCCLCRDFGEFPTRWRAANMNLGARRRAQILCVQLPQQKVTFTLSSQLSPASSLQRGTYRRHGLPVGSINIHSNKNPRLFISTQLF